MVKPQNAFQSLLFIWRRRLLSTVIFLLISSTLLVLLAARYPISRELEMGSVEHAEYEWGIDLAIKQPQVPEVIDTLSPAEIFIFSVMETSLSAHSNEVWASNVYLTDTPDTAKLSPLPDKMTLSGNRESISGRWIDLSYDLAIALDSEIGDEILVDLGLADGSLTNYTLRSIYAVKDPVDGGIAVIPVIDSVEEHLSMVDYAHVSGLSENDLREKLATDSLSNTLKEDWGVDPEDRSVISRTQIAKNLSEYVSTTARVAITVPIISGVVFLLILIREGAKARKETAPWTVTLTRIGVPARQASNIFCLLHVLTVTTATLASSALAYAIYTSGKLGLVIPPTFHTTWLITTAGITLTAALISALFLSTTPRLKAGKS